MSKNKTRNYFNPQFFLFDKIQYQENSFICRLYFLDEIRNLFSVLL